MIRKELQRSSDLELMDTKTFPLKKMKEVLSFLVLTNRYFGGTRAVLRHLNEWSPLWDRKNVVRILDIGTGAGDIPCAIAEWARRKGLSIHVTAIDSVPETVAIAQETTRSYPEITIEQRDLRSWEPKERTFDYITASLFMHHVSLQDQRIMLKKIDKMAKKGVIISDLLRSPMAYRAIQALCRLAGNEIVRHDGPLSVKRAFLPEELQALAKEAGALYLKVNREPWFRLTLAGEKLHVA